MATWTESCVVHIRSTKNGKGPKSRMDLSSAKPIPSRSQYGFPCTTDRRILAYPLVPMGVVKLVSLLVSQRLSVSSLSPSVSLVLSCFPPGFPFY